MFPKKSSQPESKIESLIGIKFKNPEILRQAFVHRSYLNENPEASGSNERLEYLGDAILEFVVSEHLFRHFPHQDEGHLTALRSRLVNTTALSGIAHGLNLGAALYMSRGEEKSGGRQNSALLANTTEALIGAIYIDQGLDKTKYFIESFVLSRLPDVAKKSLKDPKSLLQEYIQAEGLSSPIYKTIWASGPDHAKNFSVGVFIDKKLYAEARGSSKQLAAQAAAQKALNMWSKRPEA